MNQLRTVLNQSDSDDSDEEIVLPDEKNCTRDYAAGMANYRQFREQELTKAVKPGWFGGFENKPKEEDLGGSRRTRAGPPKRKHSKLRNETMVARQLQMLPTFTPYFIYFITFTQVSNFLQFYYGILQTSPI